MFLEKKPNLQQLTVNDYLVEHVNSAKLLDVMLSSDLSSEILLKNSLRY